MTLIRKLPDWHLPEREATPEGVYWNRRQVLRALGLGTISGALASAGPLARPAAGQIVDPKTDWSAEELAAITRPAVGKRFQSLFPARRNEAYGLGNRALTREAVASTYSNFYEFTLDKEQVWRLAQAYDPVPWRVEVKGLVEKPKTLDLDALFKVAPLEERHYRFRCVERWSMQVPWTGYPLRSLVEHCRPLQSARYVRLVTVLDEARMPGQKKQTWYPWPYVEALRMDEATHPLAFVALGIYGHALPMQHGAPWRVVTPWKYGYKSPKSLVSIEFTKERPATFWNDLQPDEYGFFSNVDPSKPHPRWSQKLEQDIGTGETRATQLYNGYAASVASLYDGSEV